MVQGSPSPASLRASLPRPLPTIARVAYALALALNYTTKTQYLFRINKGTLDVWDNRVINAYQPQAQRPVPFFADDFLGMAKPMCPACGW